MLVRESISDANHCSNAANNRVNTAYIYFIIFIVEGDFKLKLFLWQAEITKWCQGSK